MQSQANAKTRPDRRTKPRPEYIAAVRYHDGRRELFKVKDAANVAEARAMVLAEVIDATAVVICPRH